jgi:hypothetical protein
VQEQCPHQHLHYETLNIRRRLLLGSAVSIFALRPSRTAQADTAFTNFSFAATGAPTARTMPDRLSDIVNVKDWGALGNNSHNDTTNIQNAINYCITQGGGQVFFPPGGYKTSNLTIGSSSDIGIQLIGSGKQNTRLIGQDSKGYVVSKGGQSIDNIERIEGLSISSGASLGNGGAIKITRTGVIIRDCMVGGVNGIDASGAKGALLCDIQLSCGASGGPAASTHPGPDDGTVGIYLGTGGTAYNCSSTGYYDICFALSGNGAGLIGTRSENHRTGVRVGWGPSRETQALGCIVTSHQTERCETSIDLYNCEGCFIANNYLNGADGTPAPHGPISNMAWSAGTVTVTTPAAHNLPAGTTHLMLLIAETHPSAFIPDIGASRVTGYITATRTGPTTFTYALASNPGSFIDGAWNYPLKYGIRCRKVHETVFAGNHMPVLVEKATIDLDYGGAAEHRNNMCMGQVTEYGFILPSNTKNLAGWKFIQCEGSQNFFGTSIANPNANMVFADLPGQPGVSQDGPFEGQEYDIKDGRRASDGLAATWNDVVQGGGTGHYKARYDGTNWRRIG